MPLGLVFFGRRHIGGIDVGREFAAVGTLVARRGCAVVVNPLFWLNVVEEGPDA